jgi:(S)-sulfolactate dehydrogenase
MPKIIISEFMDETAVEKLRASHVCIYDPALVDEPEKLIELVADADALIVSNRTQVRGALLEASAKLQCVGRLRLDNLDMAACKFC